MECEIEVRDVGLLDRVVRMREWSVDKGLGVQTVRNQSLQQPIPEEIMGALAEYIGDGLAKVTVGGELGHSKEFGCKAQSFVSVSVHCNNDEKSIEETHGILKDLVRNLVNQDLEEMKQDRDNHITSDKAATPGRVAPRPQPGAPTNGPAVARPSFRR
jgi:hypothetical protein